MTKERPIIFSAPMVRALLDGRKTQTRRVAKLTCAGHVKEIGGHRRWHPADENCIAASPYGQPGDRLWVREKWRIGAWDESRPAFAIDYCDGPRKKWIDVPDPMSDDELFERLWQQSTDDAINVYGHKDRYQWEPGQSPCRWRPSIHMPRWASRITLEITAVRVERLQDISEADAMAEGVERTVTNDGWRRYCDDPEQESAGLTPCASPIRSFESLWQTINGHESWEANPWVWVVEFKRIEQEPQ